MKKNITKEQKTAKIAGAISFTLVSASLLSIFFFMGKDVCQNVPEEKFVKDVLTAAGAFAVSATDVVLEQKFGKKVEKTDDNDFAYCAGFVGNKIVTLCDNILHYNKYKAERLLKQKVNVKNKEQSALSSTTNANELIK